MNLHRHTLWYMGRASLPDVFSDKRRRQDEDSEQDKARLYEEIGRLKVELDWLKKRVP